MNFSTSGRMQIRESAQLQVVNPLLLDPGQPLESAFVADMSVNNVRSIFPFIRAINSNRITRNYTFYTKNSLVGKNKVGECSGYRSWVEPWGKPIIREHNLQAQDSLFGPVGEADIPMGRAVYSTYVKRTKEEVQTPHPKPGFPGTLEGDGYMAIVAAITSEEAINRVLGRVYHTVSIGADVESVIESISKIDIAKAYRNGEEMPEYRRGQVYDGQLSYWEMGPLFGRELSFVNAPSDEGAGVQHTDIGEYGLQLLLGQKKMGTKEFAFYDAKSLEWVMDSAMEGAWDPTYEMIDSFTYQPNTVLVPCGVSEFLVTESVASSIKNKPQAEENDLEQINMQSILETIKNGKPETLPKELLEALKGVKDKVEFSAEAWEILKGLVSQELAAEISKWVAGESELVFGNPELIKETTDLATVVVGEWSENTAALALVLYRAQEGTVNIPEDETRPCTLKDVWGEKAGDLSDKELGISLAEFRALKPEELAASVEYVALDTYFESGECKGLAILSTEGDITVPDAFWEHSIFASAEDLDKVRAHAETYSDSPESEEANQKVVEAFESLENTVGLEVLAATVDSTKLTEFEWSKVKFDTPKPNPLVVNTEFFIRQYFKALNDAKEYLAPLVGLVRKLKVDKSTLEAARAAYGYLGPQTLRTYLAQVPESVDTSTAPDVENKKIQVIPNAGAGESLDESEGKEAPTVKEKVSGWKQKFRVEKPARKQ